MREWSSHWKEYSVLFPNNKLVSSIHFINSLFESAEWTKLLRIFQISLILNGKEIELLASGPILRKSKIRPVWNNTYFWQALMIKYRENRVCWLAEHSLRHRFVTSTWLLDFDQLFFHLEMLFWTCPWNLRFLLQSFANETLIPPPPWS